MPQVTIAGAVSSHLENKRPELHAQLCKAVEAYDAKHPGVNGVVEVKCGEHTFQGMLGHTIGGGLEFVIEAHQQPARVPAAKVATPLRTKAAPKAAPAKVAPKKKAAKKKGGK